MPNLSGIEAIPKIRMIYPDIKILILTIHKEHEFLCQAISSGANGYLLKEDTDTELLKPIETIQEGGSMSHLFFPELLETEGYLHSFDYIKMLISKN
jgi:DNA-binding NarL/FixJ family response regulator